MEELFTRVWNDLVGRVTGPMTFRLVLQPAMAILFAVRDGLKDAREGRPPYFFSVFTDPSHRRYLLGEGFKAVARVLGFAVLMDAVYQFKVFRWVYPGEALLVALILAFVPYLFCAARQPARAALAERGHHGKSGLQAGVRRGRDREVSPIRERERVT